MAKNQAQAKGNTETATAKRGRKNPLSGAISEARGKAKVTANPGAAIAYAILQAAENYVDVLRKGQRAKGALWASFVPLLAMTAEEGEPILRNKDKSGVLDVLQARAEKDTADDADKAAYTSAKAYTSAVRKAWKVGIKLNAGESFDAFYKRARDLDQPKPGADGDGDGESKNTRAPGRNKGKVITGKDVTGANIPREALDLITDSSKTMLKGMQRIRDALEGLKGEMLERAVADAVRAIEAVRDQGGVPLVGNKRASAGAEARPN